MAKFKRKGCGPRGLGTAFKMITEPKRALKTVDPRASKPDALDTIAQAHYNDDPRTSLADIAKESIKRHGNFGFNLDSEEYKNVSRNYNVKKKRQQYGLDK